VKRIDRFHPINVKEFHMTKVNDSLIRRARKLLKNVKFQNYKFIVRVEHGGVHLKATYPDADIYTGVIEKQTTRHWKLTPFMTDSEIVQTAFKLSLTSFEHRAREAFKYKGAQVFGPHFDVEDLVGLCHAGREDAGGRK
jgi:hypothetical protein